MLSLSDHVWGWVFLALCIVALLAGGYCDFGSHGELP